MKKNFLIFTLFIVTLTQKVYGYSSDPKQFISEIVNEAKLTFKEINIFKPPSSRKESKESFIICKKLR